jgi:hypothetical protein
MDFITMSDGTGFSIITGDRKTRRRASTSHSLAASGRKLPGPLGRRSDDDHPGLGGLGF